MPKPSSSSPNVDECFLLPTKRNIREPGPWRAHPTPPGPRPYSVSTQTRLKLGDLFKTSLTPHWDSCDYFKWQREKSSRTWGQRMLVFLTAGKENKMKKNIPHEILTVKNINHAVFNWGSQSKFTLYSGHIYLAIVRQLRHRQTVLIIFWWLLWAVALASEKRQIPRVENWKRNTVQSWELRGERQSWAGLLYIPGEVGRGLLGCELPPAPVPRPLQGSTGSCRTRVRSAPLKDTQQCLARVGGKASQASNG